MSHGGRGRFPARPMSRGQQEARGARQRVALCFGTCGGRVRVVPSGAMRARAKAFWNCVSGFATVRKRLVQANACSGRPRRDPWVAVRMALHSTPVPRFHPGTRGGYKRSPCAAVRCVCQKRDRRVTQCLGACERLGAVMGQSVWCLRCTHGTPHATHARARAHTHTPRPGGHSFFSLWARLGAPSVQQRV